jgi:hypothetical protein
MLALAKFMGAPTEDYFRPESPVQIAIGEVISKFSEIAIEDISLRRGWLWRAGFWDHNESDGADVCASRGAAAWL